MLLEQVLHIMLNQEYPRFFVYVFFRPQIYIYFCITLYYGNMENMRKIIQTFAKPSLYKIRLCKTNPQAYVITKKTVINKSVLKLTLLQVADLQLAFLHNKMQDFELL